MYSPKKGEEKNEAKNMEEESEAQNREGENPLAKPDQEPVLKQVIGREQDYPSGNGKEEDGVGAYWDEKIYRDYSGAK